MKRILTVQKLVLMIEVRQTKTISPTNNCLNIFSKIFELLILKGKRMIFPNRFINKPVTRNNQKLENAIVSPII